MITKLVLMNQIILVVLQIKSTCIETKYTFFLEVFIICVKILLHLPVISILYLSIKPEQYLV